MVHHLRSYRFTINAEYQSSAEYLTLRKIEAMTREAIQGLIAQAKF